MLAADRVPSRQIPKTVGMHELHVAIWRQPFLADGVKGFWLMPPGRGAASLRSRRLVEDRGIGHRRQKRWLGGSLTIFIPPGWPPSMSTKGERGRRGGRWRVRKVLRSWTFVGVAHLRPEDATFEAMIRGWRAQQMARALRAETIAGQECLMRRYIEATNDYPWKWGRCMSRSGSSRRALSSVLRCRRSAAVWSICACQLRSRPTSSSLGYSDPSVAIRVLYMGGSDDRIHWCRPEQALAKNRL